MKAEDRILKLLRGKSDSLTVREINEKAKIGRSSYASRLLAKMLEDKKVVRRKEGREVFYSLNPETVFYEDNLKLTGIDESQVMVRAQTAEKYAELVSDRLDTILSFAFTEMLNNAKDHSRSGVAYVKIWAEDGVKVKFLVRDHGIGVFRSIMNSRKLTDEMAAIQELVKGKVTTQPRHHSGEGIFWTSKMADRFTLSSYGYSLSVDNDLEDWTVERIAQKEGGYVVGTEVRFEIALDSQRSMMAVFNKFSLDRKTYSFDTTEVPLKLYDEGEFWVSRPQAKRVLAGLEKYKRVILDFKGVPLVGQGFADEIFRVFAIDHPEVEIVPKNMTESVKMMVKRAQNDRTGRSKI